MTSPTIGSTLSVILKSSSILVVPLIVTLLVNLALSVIRILPVPAARSSRSASDVLVSITLSYMSMSGVSILSKCACNHFLAKEPNENI